MQKVLHKICVIEIMYGCFNKNSPFGEFFVNKKSFFMQKRVFLLSIFYDKINKEIILIKFEGN